MIFRNSRPLYTHVASITAIRINNSNNNSNNNNNSGLSKLCCNIAHSIRRLQYLYWIKHEKGNV